MLRIFFCPFCHQFFKEENRVFHVEGGPELIETHEVLLRKETEFFGPGIKIKEEIARTFGLSQSVAEVHLALWKRLW
jgi:hypothetical protein